MVDEAILKEATRALRAHTYSEAVNQALRDAIRLAKIHDIGNFIGTGVWEGDLSQMREDRSTRKRSRGTWKSGS